MAEVRKWSDNQWNHLRLDKQSLCGEIGNWREGGSFKPIPTKDIAEGKADEAVKARVQHWYDSDDVKQRIVAEIIAAAKELVK